MIVACPARSSAAVWTIVRQFGGRDVRVTTWIVLLGAAAVAPSRAWSGSPVSVTFTTSPTTHEDYAPRNVVAVWVEDEAGAFVKTLMRYGVKAADRSEIDGDPDVITGATRSGHGALTVTWNLVDWKGNAVDEGTYTIRLELTDHNSSSESDNNEGSVTVKVDGVPSQDTGMQSGGFSNISVTYAPETAPGPDAGSSSNDGGTGSATPEECATTSACVSGDGCCPIDCVVDVDDDCDPETAQSGRGGAGCSASGRSDGAPFTLCLAAFLAIGLTRRRTPRNRCVGPP
jgi:uncharacterized protein (TIGR03382 family)